MSKKVLEKLQIKDINPGACWGPDGWIMEKGGKTLASYNPATGEALAEVVQASEAAYETVVAKADEAFKTWRMMPAHALAERPSVGWAASAPASNGVVREDGSSALASAEAIDTGPINPKTSRVAIRTR